MNLSYLFLQQYWWFLVSLLGAILVFLMFVQGGQSLLFVIGKTEMQQRLLLNSTGRKWEFTFTTLVTFGGAFFASFPLFYSTSFGGAYWVWILLLLCFVLQAVSYEFQAKKGNLLGYRTYRIFLVINGIVGPFLLGTAVGTFFNGAEFIVDKTQLTEVGMPVISRWATCWHGLEAASVVWNLCLGAAIFFLSRVLALLYFINNVQDNDIDYYCHRRLPWEASLFLVFFLLFVARLFIIDGYAVNHETNEVFMQPHKYLHNMFGMPVVLSFFIIGVALVLYGIIDTIVSKYHAWGIWFAGGGTVLTVLSLLLCAGLHNTAYYPSNVDLQSSLTITNSSSSYFTLQVMMFVSFLIPFVIAYIFYIWRTLDVHKIDEQEINEGNHIY